MRTSLALILALFVTASVILTMTVPTLYLIAQQSSRHSHAAIAEACALAITTIPATDGAAQQIELRRLRIRYDLASVVLRPRAARDRDLSSDTREVRITPQGTVEVVFTSDAMSRPLRLLRVAVGAAGIASLTGVVLLITSIFSLFSRPDGGAARSAAHGSSRPETSYLFETFETSIRTLRGRETELRRLHDQERGRAEELATMTATLVRSLASGFIATDERGLIVDMNAAARELLAIPPLVNPAGRSIGEVMGDNAFGATLQEAIDGQRAFQRHEVSDSNRTIGLTTVPLRDERERYFGMLALFTDLTPMRKLENRIRDLQSLADLGEMSAGIAHEFRNSLSTILGYLRLMSRSSLPQEAAQRVEQAEKEAHLLNDAVKSLLSFARPLALQMQKIQPRDLLRDLVEQLRPEMGATRVGFEGDEITIDADPLLLRRAFENLLRNALEAITAKGDRGRVVIRTSASPTPSVSISDNGIGIGPEDISRLFLPFQSNKASGFGLGLALAKKIVLLHGGTIELTGQPGVGAEVLIEFPQRFEGAGVWPG